MKSQIGSNKRILIGLLLLLIPVIAAIVYYWFFHPVVSEFFIEPKEVHKGIGYLNNNTYMDFESGEEFQKFISSTEEIAPGQIVDFYHIDHRLKDNPIHGKMCDIFSVEIQMDEGHHSSLTNRSDLAYCGSISDDYELYLLTDYEPQNERCHGLIAICNTSPTVRMILLTDTEPEQFSSGYCSIIIRQSYDLSWNAN